MAQIDNRGLKSNSVDGAKIRLSNNEALRARNFADTSDVNIAKLNISDEFEFLVLPKYSTSNLATESYVTTALSGFANAYINKGAWDASTNTPTLANGVGTNGWVYRANVAGTVDFGAGDIVFEIGDLAVYNGTIWEKFDVIDNELPNSTTDDLLEGLTNLYFTDTRARTASVIDDMTGSETDQAPSVSSVKLFIDANSDNTQLFTITLTGTDISNGYFDLPVEVESVLDVTPKGFPSQFETDDYTLSTVSSVTRITFAGDMLSLIAGDKVKVIYSV